MEMSIFRLINEEMTFSILLSTIFIFSFFFLVRWLEPSTKNLPPSPPKLPLIGNLHQLGHLPYRSLKTLAEKYGPIMLLHLGSKPTLIISSPEMAESVLKTHDLNFSSRPEPNFVRKITYNYQDILFAPYGEYWRQARSICVHQLLSNKRVQSFRSIREEEVASVLENITESCSSRSPVNVTDILTMLTYNIMSRVAIGRRLSGNKVGNKFKKLSDEFLEIIGCFDVSDYIPWLWWINKLNGLEGKVDRVAKEFDEYIETIIEQAEKKREENFINDDHQQRMHNFIDVLLDFQEKNDTGFVLQRDAIKAIIIDMFIAGTDTISTLVESAILELLKSKSAMTRLKNEVRGLRDSKSNRITEDDLENLPYLAAVIKETCRLHPPAPMLPPRKSKDSINIMGYDIPAGTQVFINVFAIGMDSSVWENVDKFQPERFLDSSIDLKGKHFELIPFGSGRRSCPGTVFGLITTQLTLANLILDFNFAIPSGARLVDVEMSEVRSLTIRRKMALILEASLAN
ncbi:OLC1v1015990C1 [Oldenlandia corymbosa var. corymbosa]|uniref:OLC1v1015990C1 n=1 Tax=Oldenlandia corymbosa var. corymbosa TaxID=529605 RepID=A0AAV1E766_OLDCO|nr:OLC1v1015990C1 [Oldenlandia corymbosa var. corymbosa]